MGLNDFLFESFGMIKFFPVGDACRQLIQPFSDTEWTASSTRHLQGRAAPDRSVFVCGNQSFACPLIHIPTLVQPGPDIELRPPDTGVMFIWVLILSFSADTWEMIPISLASC